MSGIGCGLGVPAGRRLIDLLTDGSLLENGPGVSWFGLMESHRWTLFPRVAALRIDQLLP